MSKDYIEDIMITEEHFIINGSSNYLYKVWGYPFDTMYFTHFSLANEYKKILVSDKVETGNAWYFNMYGKPIPKLETDNAHSNQYSIIEVKINGEIWYRIGEDTPVRYEKNYYDAERDIRLLTGYYGCNERRYNDFTVSYDKYGNKER